MKINFPSGTRNNWYDRNLTPQLQRYMSGQIAPHASALRINYTVPAGKMAIIGGAIATMMRGVAATSVAEWAIQLGVTYSTGNLMIVELYSLSNAIGAFGQSVSSGQIILPSNSVVTGYTWDLSTGGTVRYTISLDLNEFDV